VTRTISKRRPLPKSSISKRLCEMTKNIPASYDRHRGARVSGVCGSSQGRGHHLHPGLDQRLVVDLGRDSEDVAQQARAEQ
jgi:hypothetical protein